MGYEFDEDRASVVRVIGLADPDDTGMACRAPLPVVTYITA
jgi:hypothetical protein